MFHPGVWLKNFVLGELGAAAWRRGGESGDRQRHDQSSSLRIPGGSVGPSRRSRRCRSTRPRPRFRFKPGRFKTRLFVSPSAGGRRSDWRRWCAIRWSSEFWPLAVECSRADAELGRVLGPSAASMGRAWGSGDARNPAESRLRLGGVPSADGPSAGPFAAVLGSLQFGLGRLSPLYRVRSHAHPAPELAADGAWLEAPFWIWTDDDPRRRRVFVCSRGDEFCWPIARDWKFRFDFRPSREAAAAIEQLAALAARGIHLRSRALLTTLAARLLLGDLFLHGIGGAKYDRLTDDDHRAVFRRRAAGLHGRVGHAPFADRPSQRRRPISSGRRASAARINIPSRTIPRTAASGRSRRSS